MENVIEQSAILCDGTLLEVPAALLDEPLAALPISSRLGAAARLRLPPSTLESKIRRHRIDKFRYHASRV